MSFILGSMAMQVVIKRHGRDRGAPVRKHVLIAFCDEADDQGRISARYEGKLANEHLARRAECDPSSVKRAKAELVNDGWLSPVGQMRRGRGKATLYRVNVDKLRTALRAVQADLRAVEEADLAETPGGRVILDGSEGQSESGSINDFSTDEDPENQQDFSISGSNKHHLDDADVNQAAAGMCKTGGNQAQEADCEGETDKVAQISTTCGKVAQISAESGSNKHHNPINPPPPYSPPPPVSAASSDAPSGADPSQRLGRPFGLSDGRAVREGDRPPGTFAGTSQPGPAAQEQAAPVTWSVLKARLSEVVGREAALCLISGASITNGTLIFSDRFKFAEARHRHGELLARAGVRVITMDTPDAEAVRLCQAGKV